MNCPICGKEMKNGRIHVIQKGGSNLFGHSVAFYNEEDCQKSFLKKPFLRPSYEHNFQLFDTRDDMPEGFYCPECKKIVSLLDAEPADFF